MVAAAEAAAAVVVEVVVLVVLVVVTIVVVIIVYDNSKVVMVHSGEVCPNLAEGNLGTIRFCILPSFCHDSNSFEQLPIETSEARVILMISHQLGIV